MTYRTILGDTWDKIALETLGSEYLFPLLLEVNQDHRHTLMFSAGVELIIPEVDVDDYEPVPEWLSDDLGMEDEELEEELTPDYASEDDS